MPAIYAGLLVKLISDRIGAALVGCNFSKKTTYLNDHQA